MRKFRFSGTLSSIEGSLRRCDGSCNEKVTSNLNFTLSEVFCDHVENDYVVRNGGEVSFQYIDTSYNSKEWKIRLI